MDRREFLAKAGLAATWAGVSITVGACSSDSGDGGTAPGTGDVTGSIGANHGHGGAVVTEAQILAGQAVTLTLTTGAGHTHTLDLTAQQVMDIGDGMTVVQSSSFDSAHDHPVTFN